MEQRQLAEAWDDGHRAGWDDREAYTGFPDDATTSDHTRNPYRSEKWVRRAGRPVVIELASKEVYDRFKLYAERNELSESDAVRQLLRRYVDESGDES